MEDRSKSRQNSPSPGSSGRLNSWKEIAAYLGRDPRTVQLWEHHEGLPVHRLAHQSRSSVFAVTTELDAWLEARDKNSSSQHPPPVSIPSAAVPDAGPRTRQRWTLAAGCILTALLAGGVWLMFHPRRAGLPSPPTLAVLPFREPTSVDTLLADNLTDGVLADLEKIGKIPLVARESVLATKGYRLSPTQIAAQLHASLQLQGTVAQANNQVHVTIQLLDAAGNYVWGATYTSTANNSSAWQDDLASQIAVEVTRRLTGSAPEIVFAPRTIDPKARQAYLAGRYAWNQRDLPSLQRAIHLFGDAIAIDPKFAAPYAGLAEAYVLMTDHGVLDNDEAFHRARAAAQTALALDPSSAQAYNALAFAAYRQDWNFSLAEQYFQKAIALDPNYPVAHQWYGEFLGDLGRFSPSIAELRKARDLDPLSPMVGADLADGYLHADRLGEASAELQRILDLYPDFVPAHLYRIAVYARQRNYAAALAEAIAYQQHTGDRSPVEMVTILQLVAEGHPELARKQAAALLDGHTALDPYRAAQVYFATGQDSLGYAALDKAYQQHSWWLVTMLVDPGFDSVRGEPRFLSVARRVGLPVSNAAPLGSSLAQLTR